MPAFARIALSAAFLAAAGTPALAKDWVLDTGASTVRFEVEGGSTTGRFTRFEAEITLDPDNLDTARIDARVMPASLDGVSDSQARNAITGKDGLAPDTHEAARFVAGTVRKAGEGYEAVGEMTLKGVTRPLTLPFTLQIDGDTAEAEASFTIDRTRFGVGSGWDVPDSVRIVLDLKARAAS